MLQNTPSLLGDLLLFCQHMHTKSNGMSIVTCICVIFSKNNGLNHHKKHETAHFINYCQWM